MGGAGSISYRSKSAPLSFPLCRSIGHLSFRDADRSFNVIEFERVSAAITRGIRFELTKNKIGANFFSQKNRVVTISRFYPANFVIANLNSREVSRMKFSMD